MLANSTPLRPHPVDGENHLRVGRLNLQRMKSIPELRQPTPESVAQRIRSIRKSRGWTLHDIEANSGGSIKAVVMGSYERGTRAISLARALEIANLFAIPIGDLLGDPNSVRETHLRSQRFDQRRVSQLMEINSDRNLLQLHRFLIAIAQRRGDWNGEILTLRSADLDTLTLLLEMKHTQLSQWLSEREIAFG